MGTPNSILKAYIAKTEISVIEISRWMGVSPARVYQWLDGENIPEVRIRSWIFDPKTPEPIRGLARRMAGESEQAVGTGNG